MKWFFYLLVLANGVLFFWQTQVRAPIVKPAAQPVDVASAPRLLLLSELNEKAKQPRPEELTSETPPRAPAFAQQTGVGTSGEETRQERTADKTEPKSIPLTNACFQISGIESEVAAERIAKTLTGNGARVKVKQEQSERKRYGVLLGTKGSQTPKAIMARLNRAGFRDYYLIKSGDYRDMLSLGVFSTKDAAERRVSQIKALKLKPRLIEVSLSVTHYGLRVAWLGGQVNWPKDLQLSPEAVPCK